MEIAVKQREIEFLVHFTQAVNLESIITNGIIPVSDLDEKNMSYMYNDEHRIDGCLNASCFSIQFPNYKFFYPLRQENPSVDWVVLGIDKSVLWEKDCLFCKENAASNNVRFLSHNDRRGVSAFNGIFDEIPGKAARSQLSIPKYYPTNPQAEVLVLDTVEPRYFLGVAFENEIVKEKYNHLIPNNLTSVVHSEFFNARSDYRFWRDVNIYG
ncbi:hypothetical protein CHH49_10885 [Terribacillus saccharophilus]|uniref:DarT ssDNA thymidine ADP-ribosyltransferase family protein n=1 Tax=Terribacillus saccharophilus TaxID=361277 RepID=UPI000BA7DA3F|nr:DarT ssDNA thymidine ADP-ribosyltransferase family protein [Terribacillus saccharophilus]PAF21397.1 hypothetical protein CHH49_10885 [Terribacillus saccharophilus]